MNESRSERERRLTWWRQARFGLFIHWGVYSVPAGVYQGKRDPYYAEWLMKSARIPVVEYRAFADQFDAADYNPRAWVDAALDAGMKYMVITAKHHDGFALFDSNVNDWNVVRSSPYGRDALRELIDACAERGVPLGCYYSQAQDWINGGSAWSGPWDPAQGTDMDAYVDGVVIPHLTELLSNYGPTFPALLWWDTPVGMDEDKARRIERAVHALRPGLIMNNRLYPGHTGDLLTPEQRIPAAGYPGRDWESCMTMNKTWGFASDDHDWKSSTEMIRNLIDIASKGGNYLLNVGPDAHGQIPQASLERLAEVGDWMRVHGEAIHDTRGVILDHLFAAGRCTQRPDTLYVHLFEWPVDGECVVPVAARPLDARLLGSANAVSVERTANGLRLHLPGAPTHPAASVVAIRLDAPLAAVRLPLNRPVDGRVLLPAAHGELFDTVDSDRIPAATLIGKEATLGYWKRVDEAVRWRARVDRTGPHRVSLHYAVSPESAGSTVEIRIGEASAPALSAIVPSSGSWSDFAWHELGVVHLDAGVDHVVSLKAGRIASPTGFLNLRAVALDPV